MQSIASLKNLCTFQTFAARLVQFHSTTFLLGKGRWRGKWDCKGRGKASQLPPKPPKSYAKCVTRQKRAESKKTLKDYYIHGKGSRWHAQVGFSNSTNSTEFSRAKAFRNRQQASSQSQRSERSRTTRHKKKRGFRVDDFVHGSAEFASMFGDHEEYTWYGTSSSNSSSRSSRFRWSSESGRAQSHGASSSESNEVHEADDPVAHSHRRTLGLPSSGPLTIQDVKVAFRAAALKWHPDKQDPGTSQDLAEEKFKKCVNAYDALCSDLKE